MMRRTFSGESLVIATHNQGKVQEFSELLSPYEIKCLSAADLELPEPEETGSTFVENAVLKALSAAKISGLPALADDSGVSVHALRGQPGIYSARWAGPHKDFMLAMNRIHNELGDNPDRRGAFICVLALAWPDGHVETFEGRLEGTMIWPPRGKNGFGYDPMFVPHGETRTFGEMTSDEKHTTSHRAKAVKALVEGCFTGDR